MTSRAVIPGQLQDESFANFTIRRTYPATVRQVNRVLKASETYADKGYNTFTRNCTTFVKDMVQYEAGIPAGREIFERETPGFSSLINAGIFAGKSSEFTERASMEDRFKYLGSQNDLNYGGEGNKRATKQDYRQFKESLAKSNGGYIGDSDLPNAVAENMRRLEGEDSGTLSSKLYFGTAAVNPGRSATSDSSGSNNNDKRPKLNADNIRNAINNEAAQLTRTILNVSGKRTILEFIDTPELDKDLKAIVPQIEYYGSALYGVKTSNNTAKELRESRKMLDKQINDLNVLLKIFHNDERLHLPVLHLISLLEWGIEIIDTAYEKVEFGKDAVGDVDYLRDRMDFRQSITYDKPNPDPNSSKKKIRKSIEITPSHFEAYLQIYKSPEKAIDNYARCVELSKKQNRTEAEEEEFKKRKRIEKLAGQYDNAHNYMLEKDSYSQQDVDYAFSLSKMEKKKKVYGPLVSYSSSSIYKSLILEKIFGELTQRFENNFAPEDIKDEKMISEWLDKDMCTCIDRRPHEMETVIKGLKKTMPGSTPEEVLIQLLTVIQEDWIDKVFDLVKFNNMKNKNENLMFKAKYKTQSAFKKITKKSDLRTKLMESIRRVFDADARQKKNA